jgi:hypothetical protein
MAEHPLRRVQGQGLVALPQRDFHGRHG